MTSLSKTVVKIIPIDMRIQNEPSFIQKFDKQRALTSSKYFANKQNELLSIYQITKKLDYLSRRVIKT